MKTSSIKKPVMNSTYGNLNVAHGWAEFEADAAGAVAECIKLPPMTKVIDLKLVSAALGASTTVKVDAVGESGTTAILVATSTVAAARADYDGAPVQLDEETVLTLTTAGGATTGKVDVVVQYEYIGA